MNFIYSLVVCSWANQSLALKLFDLSYATGWMSRFSEQRLALHEPLFPDWIHNNRPFDLWGEITFWEVISLGIDKYFPPTLHNGCNYLAMLGLKLIHFSSAYVTSKFTYTLLWFIWLLWPSWLLKTRQINYHSIHSRKKIKTSAILKRCKVNPLVTHGLPSI